MGKKSKRRQAKKNKKASSGDTSKQVSIGQDNINSCVEKLFEEYSEIQKQELRLIANGNDGLEYSVAISRIQKMKRRHDSVLEERELLLMTRDGPELFLRYLLGYFDILIQFVYYSWNFNAVIETYCDLQNQNMNIMEHFSDTKEAVRIQLYVTLAVLGNGADVGHALGTSFLKELQNFPDLVEGYHLHKEVINVLRVTKNFETAIAIDLDEKNPLLPTVSEPVMVKVSLLVSYIERYKAEFHHRSKKDDYFLIKALISQIEEKYLQNAEKFDTRRLCDSLIARAQWFYLISTLHDDDDVYKKGCCNLAVGYLDRVLGLMWIFRSKCSLCHCSLNEGDIKSVCEECHVACFCSINHQRLSWKKNAIDGMRIGHQALCPLMNTYRKLKLQKTSPRRFRKECLGFLAYGLKLKGKCFAKHDELQCNDELSSTAYVSDILPHLYAAETRSRPKEYLGEYAYVHNETINTKMRAIVIDWLVEVHMHWSFAPETLYLCVNIVDRYCSNQKVRRSQLQLVGTSALRLACKYEEMKNPPEVSLCVYITDNTYTNEELLDMEQDIVEKLECCFTVPTAYPFLQIFFKLVSASDLVKHAASYYNERTLQEHEFLQYRPSEVSAASVVLALNHPKIAEEDGRELNTFKAYLSQIFLEYTGFDTRKAYIPPILLEFTGFDKERIYHIAKVIAEKVAEEPITASNRQLIAVKNKYNDEKYSYISTQYDLPSMPRRL